MTHEPLIIVVKKNQQFKYISSNRYTGPETRRQTTKARINNSKEVNNCFLSHIHFSLVWEGGGRNRRLYEANFFFPPYQLWLPGLPVFISPVSTCRQSRASETWGSDGSSLSFKNSSREEGIKIKITFSLSGKHHEGKSVSHFLWLREQFKLWKSRILLEILQK